MAVVRFSDSSKFSETLSFLHGRVQHGAGVAARCSALRARVAALPKGIARSNVRVSELVKSPSATRD